MPLQSSFGKDDTSEAPPSETQHVMHPRYGQPLWQPPSSVLAPCDHKTSDHYHFLSPTEHVSCIWCADCGSMKFGSSLEEQTWHTPMLRTLQPATNGATSTPILSAEVMALIEANKGIFLDVGCSDHKSSGSIGMDIRAVEGVDIVADLEVFPWPLPDACCNRILCSHLIEHIKPWLTVNFLNECWRVMRPNGQLLLATPYAGSPRFWQDPTHVHGWMEATPQYFSCDFPLWCVYRPQCWLIEQNYWDSVGDLHVIMSKRSDIHGQYHPTNGTHP